MPVLASVTKNTNVDVCAVIITPSLNHNCIMFYFLPLFIFSFAINVDTRPCDSTEMNSLSYMKQKMEQLFNQNVKKLANPEMSYQQRPDLHPHRQHCLP